ncbi:MAG TPA: cobalamin-binding protein [Gemmatimonadota bacterium]|nr:cobalamin-binding protein [Gemmatimonadota bacterium]
MSPTSRPRLAGLVALVAVTAGLAGPAPARAQQTAELRGRVVRGRDSVPVGGQPVILHGITGDSGAALDSAVTARDGSFSFRLSGDTARTVFLVAVSYDDVLYFGSPIEGLSPPEPYVVQVYPSRQVGRSDTVPLNRRSMVLTYGDDGARVLDAIELDNPGDTALVSDGMGASGWRVALPQGATDLQALSGGMFPGGIRFQDGFAYLDPSLRPGSYQVVLQYRLPSDRAPELVPAHPTQRLEVLWSGTDRELGGGGFTPAEPVSFHGDTYRAVVANFVPSGAQLSMTLSGGGGRKAAWLFLVAGLLLAAGAVLAWRRGGGHRGAAVIAALALLGPGVRAARAGAPAPAARADSIRVTDDLGRTVRLAAPPPRIVSLVPAVTELLFALDAGDRLVGRTRYGVHPAAARSVPSVGEGMRPSVESVVARRPGLVILYAGTGNRSTLAELTRLGVPTLAVRHDRFADLYRNIARLGVLTGRPAAADSLAARLRCGLEAVAGATRDAPTRSVYLDVWEDPPYTAGSGSYLDSLVTVAGGRNVFGDLRRPSPRVSIEAVAARDPDVVVVPLARGSGRTPPGSRPAWSAVPAVAAGRVRTVDGDLLDRLGPRVDEAAGALAAAIHPELADRLRRAAARSPCLPPAGSGTSGGRRPAGRRALGS